MIKISAIFLFLNYCLGKKVDMSMVVAKIDWRQLYNFASRQALLGFCFDGIERLTKEFSEELKQNPMERDLLMTWMGAAQQIHRQNMKVNAVVGKLYSKFREDGLRCCILKGQGNALMYPNPYSRTPGDIDVWIDASRERIMEYAQKKFELGDDKCTASEIQKVTIVQLRPIFEKIKQSLNDFDAKENVLNCIKAAKWCCANKLYQQATTMLEEGLGTFLCCHYQLDYKNKTYRDTVFSCIAIKTKKTATEVLDADKELVDKILADDSVWGNKTFVTILQKVVELRNDYNHAGFKKNPFTAQKVIKIIEKLLDGIEEVLSEI